MATVSEFYAELEKKYQAGDLAACEQYIFQEMSLNKMCCGRISPIDIAGNSELGRIYTMQGRLDDAIAHYQATCDLTGRRMGQDTLEYSSALRNLALAKDKAGHKQEAYTLIKQAIEILEKIAEEKTEAYSFTVSDAAMIAAKNGDMDKACEYLALSCEAAEAAGVDTAKKAVAYGNLGMCLLKTGRKDEAKTALEKGTAYAEEVPGGRKMLAPLFTALDSLK